MFDTVPQGNTRNVQLELSVENDNEQSLNWQILQRKCFGNSLHQSFQE